jgi:hypothetical protein
VCGEGGGGVGAVGEGGLKGGGGLRSDAVGLMGLKLAGTKEEGAGEGLEMEVV